jgi:hypothetical protein
MPLSVVNPLKKGSSKLSPRISRSPFQGAAKKVIGVPNRRTYGGQNTTLILVHTISAG